MRIVTLITFFYKCDSLGIPATSHLGVRMWFVCFSVLDSASLTHTRQISLRCIWMVYEH